MRQNRTTPLRTRAGFVTVELPAVIAMLCLIGGASLCFGGHCAIGGVVALAGFVPVALLVVPSFFGKDR